MYIHIYIYTYCGFTHTGCKMNSASQVPLKELPDLKSNRKRVHARICFPQWLGHEHYEVTPKNGRPPKPSALS